MTKSIQPASKEVLSQHETQIKEEVKTLIAPKPTWDRNELKSQIEFHINSLYGKAIEENLDGYINLRFYGGSSPIDNFYKLKDIYSKLDEITNLVIKNNKKGDHNATILPVITKYQHGRNTDDNLFSVTNVYFDIDAGDIAAILEKITSILGKPSFTIASGGKTEDKQNKLHIYYRLQNSITGNKELLEFFKLKKQFAELVDTDVNFEKPTQPVRLLGSTNPKYNTLCTLVENTKNVYDKQDLLDKMASYVESNSQQLPLTANSAKDFPIHQPPLENLTLGELYDYLIQLGQAPFEEYRNSSTDPKWFDIICAINHQCQGNQDGYDLALRWSLTDKTGRSEENIRDGVRQAYYAAKPENSNKKLLTFRSIINFINNKDFVEKEIGKNPSFGSLVRVFDSTEMFGDTYVLTDKYLLVKITKGSGKNQITYLKHISDYIDVLGTGYSDSNKVYTLVKVKDRKASEILKTIPIGVKPSDLRLFLINKLNFKFEDSNSSFAYLQKYLLAREEKNTQINIVNRLGWTEENNVYLLPYKKNKKDDIKIYSVDKTDKCNSNYYLETTTKSDECLAKKGSLKDWRENICKYAFGNDLMSFCLFIPFASSWYKPLAEQPLIFHIYGESRKGKTILLNLSSSILGFSGNLGYSNWNSTLVALENLAAIKNDNLLILDELHSCTSDRVLTEAPYLFVNSRGKSRGAKNQEEDSNLASRKWQVQVLSSGENSFESELIKRNQLVRGGHRNRVIDIPAVVGDLGVFNTIHDFDKQFTGQYKPKEKGLKLFVDHLEKAALKYKGTAIEAYFNYIFNIKNHSDILVDVRNLKLEWENKYLYTLKNLSLKNMGDIASRANNFATIAASAVIACEGGILPFDKDYVFSVVGKIFHNYLNSIKDVYLTADDRAIKDILVKFLNNNLQNGFYDKSNCHNNTPYTKYYGFKRASDRVKETGVFINYKYYLAVNQYDEIFKGFSKTIVKRFLQEQDYVLPNELKKSKNDYTFEIKDKDNNKINCNLLNLVALGIVLPEDDNFPDPTSPEPTDKLKDLPCETTSEASEPIVVNTVTQNISAVTNTTAVESNVNSTFKPKWCIREKNELLDYLEPYYQEGREITYFEFQTSDLREWDKFSLHELVKPLFAIGIKGELDTKPQLFRIRNVKLTQLERETLTKCIFREAVIRERGDLLAYLQTYDNLSLNFSFKAIDEDFAKPEHIQELYFKGQFDNQVQIFKLDNGYLSESEQSAWSRIKCVWTDKHYPTTKENFYFPFNCYDYCSIAFEYWFPFLKEQIEAAISQKLKVKVQFKNYIMRSRADLASISAGCFQEYVMCAGIVEGDAKNPDNLKYLLLKKKNEKPIVIKLENGLTKEEQEILKPLELVFSKINMDTEQYLPNLNYNWVHFLDIALLTRNSDTNMIQTLKEPFYILQENTNLEELLSAISNDLIKNEGIFSKIEPEILNEFRYRDSIINEYDKLRHVPY